MIKNIVIYLFYYIVFINGIATQRSPYAGRRTGGYKDKFLSNDSRETSLNGQSLISNRIDTRVNNVVPESVSSNFENGKNNNFLVNDGASTRITANIPIDIKGDTVLLDLLNSMPREKQPFWFINHRAIEAHRNSNG